MSLRLALLLLLIHTGTDALRDVDPQTAVNRLERSVKDRLEDFFGFKHKDPVTPGFKLKEPGFKPKDPPMPVFNMKNANDPGFRLEDAFAPAVCDNNIEREMDETIEKMKKLSACVKHQNQALKKA